MGYNTWIEGEFTITPPLSSAHAVYLSAFANTRRMQRDLAKATAMPDPARIAVGLPLGEGACFFVGGTGGKHGEEYDQAVSDGNRPPADQPGLWCCWAPSEDQHHLVANEDDNRQYIEWLEYLLATFLYPWGYKLNGEVHWYGDDPLDRGTIVASANQIEVIPAKLEAFEHIELINREIDEFRELLDGDASEEELHQFLKNNERLLGLTSTADPISKLPLGSEYITDFVIRELPDGYVLVEIERPGLKLFNKAKKTGYPPERSRDFNHAIEQTEAWRAWVGRNHSYIMQKLPGISPTPLCWLIAGRSTILTSDERQQLSRYNEQYRHSLRVWTYDDFLERIETVLRRMTGH